MRDRGFSWCFGHVQYVEGYFHDIDGRALLVNLAYASLPLNKVLRTDMALDHDERAAVSREVGSGVSIKEWSEWMKGKRGCRQGRLGSWWLGISRGVTEVAGSGAGLWWRSVQQGQAHVRATGLHFGHVDEQSTGPRAAEPESRV